MEYSMEVQGNERGIDLSDNFKVPWNSMELSYISFGGTKVPWNSMEYSMKFHGTKLYFIWRHQSSMEFHGIFHGIPWNTCVILNGAFLIPWNSVSQWVLIRWLQSCMDSMEYYMKVQGNLVMIKTIISSSMEFNGTKLFLIWQHQSSMEFHGTLCHLKWRPPCSMESHGIRWYLICRSKSFMEFHGISHITP